MYKIIQKIAYAITDVEKMLYNVTGIVMPLLNCRWEAERMRNQRAIDRERMLDIVLVG